MSVKTIFKVLIGTIVIIVMSFLIIETLNISISSIQLNNMARISARQASVLLSQETYKSRLDNHGDLTGTVNMPSVVDNQGNEYISGKFYNGSTAEQIYNDLYTSADFKSWVNSNPAVIKGNWKSLELINRAINNPGSLNVSFPQYDPSMSQSYYENMLENYSDAMLAKMYKDVMMTPLNMGVPYLDKDTLTRMFKWNVAELMSNCDPSLIKQDENGDTYVYYNGFRVYADRATIVSLEYKTFDLTIPLDRSEFRQLTNIDPDNLMFDFNPEYLGTADDERQRVCLVGINYSIPIGYEGITPIRRVFDYVWNTEVEGINAQQRNATSSWNDITADLESGGFSGNSAAGVLPVPGKLIYYIIR